MKRIAFVSLVVLSLLLLSTTAQAAPPSKQRILGSSAAADFYTFDPQTCDGTYVYVFGSEIEQQSPGSGGTSTTTTTTGLYVDIYTYNECDLTARLVLSGFVQPGPGEFEAQNGAQSARIRKDLLLYEYVSGTTVPVTIDLTWNGTGEATRGILHQTHRSPITRFVAQYHSVSRAAEVTGSILLGDTNVIAQASLGYSVINHSSNGIMTRQ